MRIACSSSFEAAVQLVQQRAKAMATATDALNTLKEVVNYAEGNINSAHVQLAPLLHVACTMKQLMFALTMMQLLGKHGGFSTVKSIEAMF